MVATRYILAKPIVNKRFGTMMHKKKEWVGTV